MPASAAQQPVPVPEYEPLSGEAIRAGACSHRHAEINKQQRRWARAHNAILIERRSLATWEREANLTNAGVSRRNIEQCERTMGDAAARLATLGAAPFGADAHAEAA